MTDQLPGAFPKLGPGPAFGNVPYVMDVDNPTAGTIRDPGAIRVAPLTIQPNLTQRWVAIGWNVRARVAIATSPTFQTYAKFGQLWTGLMVDSTLGNSGGIAGLFPLSGGATFPGDFSNFDVLWGGNDDPLPVFDRNVLAPIASFPAVTAWGLLAKTFMFPSPIDIRSGSNMQMALVLTPSILGQFVTVKVLSCDFTVLYNDMR